MLFDLGSVWCLNDLGWLQRIDMITSVSGGSITNAVLATKWKDLTWKDGVATNFHSIVAQPIIDFAGKTIDIWAIIHGLISPWRTVSENIAHAYDKYLFHGATLQNDIPAPVAGLVPRFLFYATSFQTGVSVRIERKRLADYRLGEVPNPELSVAQIVGVSSAFPPFLSPATLRFDPSLWVKTQGADLFDFEDYRRQLVLTDGGVYDNIGLEALGRCSTVLVSDAGAPLASVQAPPRNWFSQTRRAMDIVTEQTRALRRRLLMDELGSKLSANQEVLPPRKKGAYWRLKTKISDFGLQNTLAYDSDGTASLQKIRTRLNSFTPTEKGQLINWGYALTDAAMRRYVLDSDCPALALPLQDWPLP